MRVVAIVGRPNVGKSALFNRLTRSRHAIVQDQPGVTRDRIYATVEWRGRRFTLIDTGGLVPDAADQLTRAVSQQVEAAVSEASLVLLLVDSRAGLTPLDEDIADRLRRSGKPLLVAVNKVDHLERMHDVHAFHRLGLGNPIPVSAEHGLGTGDLLDAIVERLPPDPSENPASDRIRVAVLGRPNVGKSSLVNALLGDERMLVSDVPGTTRDAVDIPWSRGDRHFLFIDTAGMRRPARVREPVEFYSVVRARKALERAHVALLVLDATELVTEQDRRLAGQIVERGRALIIVINKWDLVKHEAGKDDLVDLVQRSLPGVSFAPVAFVSARTGLGVGKLPEVVVSVYQSFTTDLPTSRLNQVLREAMDRYSPPSIQGRRLRIRYAVQIRTGPPTILLFVNHPRYLTESYRRYLENRLREVFPLEGTPLRTRFRASD